MSQALYYGPSYRKLQAQISEAAPGLDVVLLEEDGSLQHNGQTVGLADCNPQWFWIHSELMGNHDRLDQYFELILQSPEAEWLHTINTGLDGLPYDAVMRHKVTISNNHSQAMAIAEYVIGQVLAHYQRHERMREQQQNRHWKYTRFREIGGTNWLIIGFGHIGQEIARRVKPFNVHIDVLRRKQDTEGLADRVITRDGLNQSLAESDVVVLACNSSKETFEIADSNFFAAMKENAVLVNIARGELVNENHLLASLDEGRPSCAILDVFRQEPLPETSPLWNHPSVVVTAHCSNAGSGMLARSSALFLNNLERKAAGSLLMNVVQEPDL